MQLDFIHILVYQEMLIVDNFVYKSIFMCLILFFFFVFPCLEGKRGGGGGGGVAHTLINTIGN